MCQAMSVPVKIADHHNELRCFCARTRPCSSNDGHEQATRHSEKAIDGTERTESMSAIDRCFWRRRSTHTSASQS